MGAAKNMSKEPFLKKNERITNVLELQECKARSNSVSEGSKDHKYSLFHTGGLLRRTEKMEAILMKAASFIAVIILGYGLRKAGFLKKKIFMYCQRSCLRSHFLHPSLQIFHRLRYSLPCFCCVL